MSRTIKKPYRHSRAFDTTCRNHGSCPYCERGRLHNANRTEAESEADLDEYLKNVAEFEYQSHWVSLVIGAN